MYSESVYNGYEQLEQDPKVRRLHYLMLWTEAQDVEKFLDLLSFAFNEKKPCYCVFEVQGELQKIGIRAIHGVPDSGQSFLDWVGSWAAARKLMIRERMMIMR